MIAKIKERKEIAKGILFLTFDLQGQDIPFKPGQFFALTLINPPYTDERGNRRFLGIVNSPSEKDIFSVLTKMGVSGFKKSLAEIPLGSEVEIANIDGHINLPEDKSQPVIFFTEGIGIAPIMSILRWSKEQNWPYKLTLVYLNEDRKSAPFIEELETYTKENSKFQLINLQSLPSREFISTTFPNPDENIYFITGVPKFAPTIFRTLKEVEVPPNT